MTTWSRYAVAAVLAGWLVIMPASAAHAHRGVLPTVHHDGHGSVWVTVAWDDGHPVTEPVLATLTGHSDTGASVGPAALQALPHQPGTVTHPGALAAGTWSLRVDIAAPGIGYCTAEFTVEPDGVPQTRSCAPPAAEAAPADDARLPAALLAGLGAATLTYIVFSRLQSRSGVAYRDKSKAVAHRRR